MNRYRVYTGPTLVNHYTSEWGRLSELHEVFAGTENVWFTTALDAAQLQSLLPTWARPVKMN